MKAQITIEFFVIFLALATISLFIFDVIKITDTSNVVDKTGLEARKIADTLAAAINNVYLSGDGTKVNLKLPQGLDKNKSYNLTVYPSEHLVRIVWEGYIYTSPILVGNISSSFMDEEIVLTNKGGKIEIT
ncbi:hypothetical protein HY500_01320 [Candidatus Woesearchaeota archaeon]|nr:hypothetical protein [Candidatus Woesearchaeota archaeon]